MPATWIRGVSARASRTIRPPVGAAARDSAFRESRVRGCAPHAELRPPHTRPLPGTHHAEHAVRQCSPRTRQNEQHATAESERGGRAWWRPRGRPPSRSHVARAGASAPRAARQERDRTPARPEQLGKAERRRQSQRDRLRRRAPALAPFRCWTAGDVWRESVGDHAARIIEATAGIGPGRVKANQHAPARPTASPTACRARHGAPCPLRRSDESGTATVSIPVSARHVLLGEGNMLKGKAIHRRPRARPDQSAR